MADQVIPEEMVEKAARELYGGPHHRVKVVDGEAIEVTVSWDESEDDGNFGRDVYRRQARRVLSAALAGRQESCDRCGNQVGYVVCDDCQKTLDREAGRQVVDVPLREELIGCKHPAWPDPLEFDYGDGPQANARRWLAENRDRHPQIVVRRRLVSDWTVWDDSAAGSGSGEEP